MINLEKIFKNTLSQWGHDVFLQRIMINGNYRNNLERVTTRNVYPSGSSNAGSSKELEEGISINSEVFYFFECSVNPKEGDRIYEKLPNNFDRQTIYLVDACSPRRGKGGKIIYWTVGASKEKNI